MAPANSSLTYPTNGSLSNPAYDPSNTLKISTISGAYNTDIPPASSGGDLGPPHTEMEMENTPNRGRGSVLKTNVKDCFHSCQTLPPKTRKTLKITLIGAISILALLAIFFLVRLPEHTVKKAETFIVQHEEAEYVKFNYSPESSLDQKSKDGDMKIVKDINGKANQFGQNSGRRIPLIPHVDMERVKQRRNYWHEANETEIEETLNRVRIKVDADRKKITNKELRLWEPGSEPLRILLVSTWRSGSTFLGQMLQSHPGVFQHYEPLSYLGINQVRSGRMAFQAQQLLHRLLDCEFEKSEEYMNYTRMHAEDIIGHNKQVWETCKEGPNKMACVDVNFLSDACKLYPIQLVKTVRLRLNLTQLLLNDENLRAKVIFLIRDPRGIMSSRYSSIDWCSQSTDCMSPSELCQDMQGDLKVSSAFEKLYPNRFLKLKYEDLANNTVEEVNRILTFLGLEFTKSIKDFLEENTNTNNDSPWSIQRKSSDRIDLWKKNLSMEKIREIQNSCAKILKELNYELL